MYAREHEEVTFLIVKYLLSIRTELLNKPAQTCACSNNGYFFSCSLPDGFFELMYAETLFIRMRKHVFVVFRKRIRSNLIEQYATGLNIKVIRVYLVN